VRVRACVNLLFQVVMPIAWVETLIIDYFLDKEEYIL
jgi:hypothetical protein